nr:MAG TPA: repressor domain protein [Caudoviricetes sp.]
MNKLRIFNYGENQVRTVEIDGAMWFVGKDVAEVLGYSNPRDALAKHVDDEDRNTVAIRDGKGNPNQTIINESGLYSLILSSKLPTAKEFKRWVTSEVLPTIRKHGAYATPETLEEMLANPANMIKVLETLQQEQAARRKLEAQAEEDKPKVLFANSVEAATTSILVGDMAKLLRQNGLEIGQKRMFEYLRNNGYLIKQRGESYNMPTQRSLERGWMEIKESTVVQPNGSTRITRTPKITGKGQVYFVSLMLAQ